MNDLIDRREAIDGLDGHYIERRNLNDWQAGWNAALDWMGSTYLDELPSAQPKRKTGWWLVREGISDAQCSECKMYFKDVYDMDNSDAFCRHCGAKMEGLRVVKDE